MPRLVPGWLAATAARLAQRPRQRASTRRTLAAEQLEAREVPATFTWVPTTPGEYAWTDPANWTGGPAGSIPNAAGDEADLNGALVGNQVINLNGAITVGTLSLGSTGTGGYTIAANGGSLTFDNSGTAAVLAEGGTGVADALLSPITLAGALSVTGGGATPLTLGGDITGAGTITTSGTVNLLTGSDIGTGVTLGGFGTVAAPPVLYAASYYDSALYAFNATTGAVLATLVAPKSNDANLPVAPLDLPAGVTVGPDGALYISNNGVPSQPGVPSNNNIVRYDLDTFSTSVFITAAQLQAIADPGNTDTASFVPAGLRFGPDGNLYVSESQGLASAGAFPPVGAVIRFEVDSTGPTAVYTGTNAVVAGNLPFPSALTFGPGGAAASLYVSTVGGVLEIDNPTSAAPTPVFPFLIPDGAGDPADTNKQLENPGGLTFGPDGNLYVTDLAYSDGNSKVLVFQPDGTFVSAFIPGSGALSLQFTSDITFDAQGRAVIANLGLNGPTNSHPHDFSGSIVRYTVAAGTTGVFDTNLVLSAAFPQTGPAATDSGIIPGQIVLAAPATVTVDGTVNPGSAASTGTLSVRGLTFTAGGTFAVDLNGTTAGSGYDRLLSAGAVDLGGATLSATVGAGFTAPLGAPFVILTAAGGLTGTFAAHPEASVFTVGTQEFRINYMSTSVVLTRVATPSFTSANTATFYTGKNNTFTVSATGFPAPTLSMTGGTLPPGVMFNATTGVLSGTPTMTGTFMPEFTATNDVGSVTQTLTLTVDAGVAPTITSADHATFAAGTGGTFTVTATGTPTPTLAETAALPAGVTFTPATGVLAVDNTAAVGTYTLTFTADNGVAPVASQTFTLVVGTAPAITSADHATFFTGLGGTFTVTATGSPAPTLNETDPLPAGVTFAAATGVLTVDATTAAGSYTLTFTADNGVNPAASQTFTLTVTTSVAPAITSADHATFVAGTGGTFTVTATGTPTPTLAETAALPAGVTFTPATGVLAVDNTAAVGTYTLTFTATNGINPPASQTFTLTVGTTPAFTSANSATFFTGLGGTFTVSATGSPTPTLAETAALPAGVTFAPATGTLTVANTTAAGTYNLTFTADNGVGPVVSQPFTLTVTASVAPAITSANNATFTAGTGGTFTVTATGTPAPTLAETAALPAGVTFTPATGALAVDNTTAAGTYTLTFTATNGIAPPAIQTFTLTVGTAPVFTSANSTVFPAGAMGTFQVTATGLPAPTFAFTAGTLPAGVTLSPAGVLSGTATATGTFPITITATNSIGTATQAFTLTVGTAPAITSADAALFTVGVGGTFQVTASGLPAPTLGQTAALPAGVTFNSTTGVLTVGPAAAIGVSVLNFTATNVLGGANHSFTLTVAAPSQVQSRLSVGGQSNGSTAVFDPNAAGQYPTVPAATVNPFEGLGVVIRSAVADVNGDGVPDTIMVTGPGTPVRFAVVSGTDNKTILVPATAPFSGSEDFSGGGFVSAGDLDGDGRAEIAVSPDQGGGPRVTIFTLPSGATIRLVTNFLGIDDPNFRGGARTAIGDVNRDGRPDLAVAAGFLGGPRVALFDGATLLTTRTKLVGDFFAFPGTDAANLRNGAFVAIGDVNGDGFDDLIFGGGPGGAPRVFVLSGATVSAGNVAGAQASPLANFFVANNTADRGGARVSVVDADGDGLADIAVGSGPGAPAQVRIYLGKNVTPNGEPTPFQNLVPFSGAILADGVYVG